MKKIYYLIFSAIFILLLSSKSSIAQDNILYGMKNIPQSAINNPAKQPTYNVYIGFPALSNLYINASNSGFSVGELFKTDPNQLDSFTWDLANIESVLKDKNFLSLQTDIALLEFGFSLKNDFYFTFSITNRTTENLMYPKSILELRNGNYRADETPIQLHFGQNLSNYNEYAIGLSKKIFPNFTMGWRLKLLSGLANTRTKKMQIDWTTETAADEIYTWTFDTDFDVRMSSPQEWEVEYDSIGNISKFQIDSDFKYSNSLIFSRNIGLAVDCGIEYKPVDFLTLSASLVDFGFIKWRQNPIKLKQNGQFIFDGLDIADYIGSNSNEDNDLTDEVLDSITEFINPTIEYSSYSTMLNSKIFIGAYANVAKGIDFGLLYRGYFYNKRLHSALTISANANFLKGWAFSASYTLMNRSFNNLGLGLAYKLGPIQMYMLTDNISPALWAVNESSLSDKWIRNTKSISFHFGINFIFSKDKTDRGLID